MSHEFSRNVCIAGVHCYLVTIPAEVMLRQPVTVLHRRLAFYPQ